MRKTVAVLKSSAWGFGIGAAIVVVLTLQSALGWGWSTASNWGYFLMWIFIGAGLMIVSAITGLVSGIVLLIAHRTRARDLD